MDYVSVTHFFRLYFYLGWRRWICIMDFRQDSARLPIMPSVMSFALWKLLASSTFTLSRKFRINTGLLPVISVIGPCTVSVWWRFIAGKGQVRHVFYFKWLKMHLKHLFPLRFMLAIIFLASLNFISLLYSYHVECKYIYVYVLTGWTDGP